MIKRKIPLIVVLLLALVVSTVTFSFAWFSTGWDSRGSHADFTAGKTVLPEITMFTYSTDVENPQSPGWKAHTVQENPQNLPSGDRNAIIPGVQGSVQSGTYTFNLESLQMGTVDNLLWIREDNILYFRVKIKVKEQGNTQVSVDMNASPKGVVSKIYDKDGKEVPLTEPTAEGGTLAEEIGKINTTHSLFQYAAVVSDQNITPVADNKTIEPLFQNATLHGLGTAGAVITPGDTITAYPKDTNGDEVYYLYIKLMPNLKVLGSMTALLNKYMPCITFYGLDMILDIR